MYIEVAPDLGVEGGGGCGEWCHPACGGREGKDKMEGKEEEEEESLLEVGVEESGVHFARLQGTCTLPKPTNSGSCGQADSPTFTPHAPKLQAAKATSSKPAPRGKWEARLIITINDHMFERQVAAIYGTVECVPLL